MPAPVSPRLAADASLADLRAVLATDPPAVLLDRDGEPVGVVRPGDVEQVGDGPAERHASPLDELPVVDADGPADRLVGLLDRDQPLVLVAGAEGTWLSSLHLIDDRIRHARGDGVPDGQVPG